MNLVENDPAMRFGIGLRSTEEKLKTCMRGELPSRQLFFSALIVSGIFCLIYCLSIALLVNPDMEEYSLIILTPFLSFIFINLCAVYLSTKELDELVKNESKTASIDESTKERLNKIHVHLTTGLFPLFIFSTIIIHLFTMWIEDEGLGFLVDPDSWTLLINRCALFLLVAIIQSNLFDKYICELKNRFPAERISKNTKQVSLFKRTAWTLISLSLFLGSSIPIFSTMRFDNYIDEAIPSINVNFSEVEGVDEEVKALITLLELELEQYANAQIDLHMTLDYFNNKLLDDDFTRISIVQMNEVLDVMHDDLPLIDSLENGMDTQNTLSYVFILLTLLAGLTINTISSQAFSLQISLIRSKIKEMLASDKTVSGRLHITGIDETAMLAADFNRILDYNEEINVELLKADKVKDAFLANVSHELKTPLHGIIGIAESLVDGVAGKLPHGVNYNLQLIYSSGRRLSNLVNDILDFSRLHEHDIALDLRPLDLKTLVDVILELSRPLTIKGQVLLRNEVDGNIPAVMCDENRIHQVLLNLVGNAIKFTQKGRITVRAVVREDMIEVQVIDSGIGIHEDKLESIFHSFEQADSSISRCYGGTGLGLSISRNLVELHGGELKVKSTEGTGSTFSFTLPASFEEKIDPEGSLQTIAGIQSKDHFEENEIPADDRKNYTVLVVDDEPINLTVLENYLTMSDYKVLKASNGENALALYHQHQPDMVLLDVMMPKMSGFEVCRKLREDVPIHKLPIIMLTAKSQTQDFVEGFSSGANDYLTKPFTKEELLSRIKTHLELSKINRVYSDFVPTEYLSFLGHDSILDVRLGDNIHCEMTIMFADIRSYTKLSEKMTPAENFEFVNDYLSRMGPCISNNEGFVNQYLGDGLMALFPGSPESAIKASISMSESLKVFNEERKANGLESIEVGIGLHFGKLIFGIIGDEFRKCGNVLSDDVNIASRLEGLTKYYGSSIIVSKDTLDNFQGVREDLAVRFLGKVIVKGKSNLVSIYELLEVEEASIRRLKVDTANDFESGLQHYFSREFGSAGDYFKKVLSKAGGDKAAQVYLEQCVHYLISEPDENWNGAVVIDQK